MFLLEVILICILSLIVLWDLAKRIDKFITVVINKIPALLVGDKTSFWVFRPAVIVMPVIIIFYAIWESLGPGDKVVLGFVPPSLYVVFTLALNGTREYIGTVIDLDIHKQWARAAGLTLDRELGWKTKFREREYIMLLGRNEIDVLNQNKTIPEKCTMIIRTINSARRSFILPQDNFELWDKIGAEHLEAIKKYRISLRTTKAWFVAEIEFSDLQIIGLEKLFEIMYDAIKEVEYRLGAGFDYRPY